jgi:hypothetical protein
VGITLLEVKMISLLSVIKELIKGVGKQLGVLAAFSLFAVIVMLPVFPLVFGFYMYSMNDEIVTLFKVLFTEVLHGI